MAHYSAALDICLEQRDVVHFERFRDFLQNSNPLDRLSFSEYLEIMQSDVGRWSLKLFESWWLEDEVLYFVNPLIYRVEIDPVATVLGFQRNRSGVSIEVDGHEDCHWNNVLQVLNGSTISAVRSPAPVRDLPVPPRNRAEKPWLGRGISAVKPA